MSSLTITISTSAEKFPSSSTYIFDRYPVRVFMIDGSPWFAAVDVCNALGLADASTAIRKLDEDERMQIIDSNTQYSVPGTQINNLLNVVSESGMNALVLRCRDAMTKGTPAHKFRKWVTSEVLPTIRKTGGYIAPAEAPVQRISERDLCLLKNYLQSSTKTTLRARSNYERLLNYLCVRFGVERLEHLPASEVAAANAEARRVDSQIAELRGLLIELEHEAFTGYLTQSAPLIRSLKRKYKPELERIAGNPLNIRKLIAEDYLSTVSLSA